MITELHEKSFRRCLPLLEHVSALEAKAVLQGVNRGRVFVDDSQKPRSGFVWLGNHDGFLFFGDAANEVFLAELQSFLLETIYPNMVELGLQWFEAISSQANWEPVLKNVFNNSPHWQQHVYLNDNFQNTHEQLGGQLSGKYELLQLSNETDNYFSSLLNYSTVKKTIEQSWYSLNDFYAKGIGYCIVFERQVISYCYSSFVSDHYYIINIWTDEKFRRQSLALETAQAFIRSCQEKQGHPYWDCTDSNRASNQLAQKLGLKIQQSYTGYEYKVPTKVMNSTILT
ncbi:GNAT family N-acetyltransferase [Alkalihalobacillus pseudalcaliphilus]|uniref:GNAT family N-acetyltransferase n=1 Tax=Alkalihalobacillus pseudalcaliphilus TaxID=79884 RepID=UPI00064DC663|nr:GNAT family N-acetyltransferase [Alkalihalobacillus pseudalcaliphilus]KMK76233.1 hypothetical protein AB990_13550 [Alkalihalobacillus pseudalcaliphilus]